MIHSRAKQSLVEEKANVASESNVPWGSTSGCLAETRLISQLLPGVLTHLDLANEAVPPSQTFPRDKEQCASTHGRYPEFKVTQCYFRCSANTICGQGKTTSRWSSVSSTDQEAIPGTSHRAAPHAARDTNGGCPEPGRTAPGCYCPRTWHLSALPAASAHLKALLDGNDFTDHKNAAVAAVGHRRRQTGCHMT